MGSVRPGGEILTVENIYPWPYIFPDATRPYSTETKESPDDPVARSIRIRSPSGGYA